ncbi:nucleoside triphosphate pyrophosphohydrolase [Yunchengibacter salinarum]|uniref:nucleoside triphosphate pyrophosphohydrolase n=1 Tax=Yunchengibacter salinarum TaxID=3133399 RepID=UPI0035B5F0B4
MSSPLDRLRAIMAALRDPKTGCPWDVEQSFETIAPYTIEEAYEVDDAIRAGDWSALKDELGDLLLQVVFHSRIAEEAGLFSFDDVAEAIAHKMVRRHPHVFGDAPIHSAGAQSANWEAQKEAERQAVADREGRRPSALDGVAPALPALLRAHKLQKRAARVGFDWNDPDAVLDKIAEEARELAEARHDGDRDHIREEMGDLLFVVVNLARHLKLDPEEALRGGNAKFERRFRAMEDAIAEAGERPDALSLDQLEEVWQAVKRREKTHI